METKNGVKSHNSKEEVKTSVKTKVVNLCEDMNPHIHNEKSYEKLTQDSKKD
jgi:hypothetical protein